MVWAKENNKQYDVFVFLGTNKMNLRDIKKTIKEYQAFFNKKVKYVFYVHCFILTNFSF